MKTLNLNEEQIEQLEIAVSNKHNAITAFKMVAALMRSADDKIWEIIREQFPNEKIVDGHLNWNTKKVILIENDNKF